MKKWMNNISDGRGCVQIRRCLVEIKRHKMM